MGIAAIREKERREKERQKKQKEEDDFARTRQEANYQAWQARKKAEKEGTRPSPTPTPTPTSTPAGREEENPLCGLIIMVILLAIFGYFLFGYGFHDSCDTTWGEFLGICGLLWVLYSVFLSLSCCTCFGFLDICGCL